LTTKAIVLTSSHGRWNEALALLRFALETALEHDKPSAGLRASYNLADQLAQVDRYGESAETVRGALAQARRVGNRYWELSLLGQLYSFFALGEWDEALAMMAALPLDEWEQVRAAFTGFLMIHGAIHSNRGRLDDVAQTLKRFEPMAASADVQERASYESGLARLLLAQGQPREALEAAERAFDTRAYFGYGAEMVKEGFVIACEAALALGDRDKLTELVSLVDALPPGRATHFLRANVLRFRAHLAHDGEADRLFRGSLGLFQELMTPFPLAVVQLEYAEWLFEAARADDATPLLATALATFEGLEATPWVERAKAHDVASRAPVPA
jgi:tetratricopeptide (TPR) repeat protein